MTSKHTLDYFWNWHLILLDEFYRLQSEVPSLASLSPANIIISDTLTSTLGRWTESLRTIELSAQLLDEQTFESIREVFLHEVAHQVVSELYGISHAKSHGEAFKRACKLIGTASTPAQAERISVGDRSRLFERVKKLLAMESSDNKHEAELALKKARELSLRYNLNMDHNRPDYTIRPIRKRQKRIPGYQWMICSIIETFYFCKYISKPMLDQSGDRYQIIEFYGLPENLDIADYVFHYLLHHGELEWQHYRTARGLGGRSHRNSFLNGLYSGFKAKLDEQTQRLEEQQALVWVGDPKLDAFYRTRNPRVTTRKSSYRNYRDTHQAGHAKGRELSIHPGLTRSKSGKPDLLT